MELQTTINDPLFRQGKSFDDDGNNEGFSLQIQNSRNSSMQLPVLERSLTRKKALTQYRIEQNQQNIANEEIQRIDPEIFDAINQFYDPSNKDGNKMKLRNQDQHNVIYEWFKQLPVFTPNSPYVIAWEIFMGVITILTFFIIPIYVAFGNETFGNMPYYYVDLITYVIFFLYLFDMGVEFMTAYYNHGSLIKNKKKIALYYLNTYFFYDLIAVFTYGIRMSFNTNQYRWVYYLFFFKFPSLMRVNQFIEETVLLHLRLRNFYQLLKILFYLFFSVDLFGCYFYSIGVWSVNNQYLSWLNFDSIFGKIIDLPIHQQMFFAFYFSLGTLSSTMGYGDLAPKNIYECAYCLVGILFAVFILSLNISLFNKVIEDFQAKQTAVYKKRISINKFLKTKNVPDELSEKVRQYLNEHWTEKGSRDLEEEQQIIESLAPELKDELILSSYGNFLKKIPMFKDNFSRQFLKELAFLVKEMHYSQGEVIFYDQSDDIQDDHSFYYLVSGSVMIRPNIKSTDYELKQIKIGEFFGEFSFFTGMPRLATAEATTYSLLYKISRVDFLKCLENNPEDKEIYHQIKDKLKFSKDFSAVQCACWVCGSPIHYSTQCTLTHYNPITNFVVNQSEFSQLKQQRIQFARRDNEKWKTLLKIYNLVHNKSRKTLIKKQKPDSKKKVLEEARFSFAEQEEKDREEQKQQAISEIDRGRRILQSQFSEYIEELEQKQDLDQELVDDQQKLEDMQFEEAKSQQNLSQVPQELQNKKAQKIPRAMIQEQKKYNSIDFTIHLGQNDMDMPKTYKKYFNSNNYSMNIIFQGLNKDSVK